jgi:uncharacterized protein DUF4397
MRISRLMSGLITATTLLAACRDAQTEKAVQTKTAGGDVSTSMSGDSADKRGMALVRVVSAVPGKNLVVRADRDHQLAPAAYRQVTEYQPIDRNWVTFEVGTTGDSAFKPLATNREMLTDGYRYTLVVIPDSGAKGYETRVLRDEISDDTSKAFLRVIHAARGIDEVNIVERGGDTLLDGVNFAMEGGYRAVTPWTGTLEVRSEDGKRLLHTIPGLSLKPGHSCTVVLTRGAGGKVESFRFEDAQLR